MNIEIISLNVQFPYEYWWGGYGWEGAGLTENKTKPSSWGLAELGNNLKHHHQAIRQGRKEVPMPGMLLTSNYKGKSQAEPVNNT